MNVLVDTGVWIAFCDSRERLEERETVEELLESLGFNRILLPWPVMYETVRTRFSRNVNAVRRLERIPSGPNLIYIDDDAYRESALRLVFETSFRRPPRPLSMVDCLLRLMLADANLKIDRFATYNENDFRDVCGSRRIEMVR